MRWSTNELDAINHRISNEVVVFSETDLADEDILSMRQLCRHRMDLVDHIADQKRKIIGVLDRVFPEYQTFFSDMFGKTSTELLGKAVTPEELLAIPSDDLCNLLRENSRGRFDEAKAEELRSVAQSSFGITIGTAAFTMQLRQLLEMIALLERQLTEMEGEIEQEEHHYTAIGAVARKLTFIIYAVLRDNKPYVPNC